MLIAFVTILPLVCALNVTEAVTAAIDNSFLIILRFF